MRSENCGQAGLLLWAAYSQCPGCESVKRRLIETVMIGNVAAVKNGTLSHPQARAEILRRIEALTPRSERRWGRMTPHQMVCHLSDACRAALGERRVPVIGTLWERTVIRWLAIHTNVKWPQGVRTVPEADQELGGTRPTEFARDVDELRGLIQRFSGPEAQLSGYHPLFGALSAAEWGRFSYRHADHHLRQFGAYRKRAISRFVGTSSACCFAVSRRMCERVVLGATLSLGGRRIRSDPIPAGPRLDPDDGALPWMQTATTMRCQRPSRNRAERRVS